MQQKSVNISNSNFSGNIIQGDVAGNVVAQANQNSNMGNNGDTYNIGQAGAVGPNSRSDGNTFNVFQSEQKQTLAQAAADIQKLLKQLEQDNPTATDSEKINHVNDETTPSFKRRVVSALQAGGETAIDEFLDNPYFSVAKATVKGWLKPE